MAVRSALVSLALAANGLQGVSLATSGFMPPSTRMIFEIAHHMALIPVLWLALTGRGKGQAWWYLSGIFLVSWLADWAAHWANPFVVSPVYLVTQAAIVGAVFLPRRDAILLVIALVVVGAYAVVMEPGTPDVLVHTVAWGTAAGIVFPLWQLGRLRTALLVVFGAGLLAWWLYVLRPGYPSWGIYQGTRLLGILLFCWASLETTPHFRLISKKSTVD